LEIISWLETEAETTDSEYLISSRARDLTERVTADLESVGLAPTLSRPLPGAEYLSVLADTVESLLGRLDVEGAGSDSRDSGPETTPGLLSAHAAGSKERATPAPRPLCTEWGGCRQLVEHPDLFGLSEGLLAGLPVEALADQRHLGLAGLIVHDDTHRGEVFNQERTVKPVALPQRTPVAECRRRRLPSEAIHEQGGQDALPP